jgi:hypothetical protein
LKKITLAGLGVVLVASGLSPALANGKPGGGTMPASSAYGLCKAYFAGSDTGKAHKRNAPPFVDLVAKADAANQAIEDFCAAQTPGGK